MYGSMGQLLPFECTGSFHREILCDTGADFFDFMSDCGVEIDEINVETAKWLCLLDVCVA